MNLMVVLASGVFLGCFCWFVYECLFAVEFGQRVLHSAMALFAAMCVMAAALS